MNYVILGCGPAGIAAAEAIRSLDSQGELTLVTDDRDGYYSRPGLAYYLTGEIPENGLYPFQPKELQRLRMRHVLGRAVRIDAEAHRVLLQDGHSIGYQRLLVAIGAEAASIQNPGVELQGVFKLDTLENARYILKMARKAKEAVVVGGGITALEIVEGLRARGVKVHYFLRGDRYWANVLDEKESRIVEHMLTEDGVQLHFETDLDEILGKGGKVTGVRTTGGKVVKCDMVGVAVGIKPRVSLAKESGIEVEKGVIVDEFMQTSAVDVLAAGDVAQVRDPVTGKSYINSLWTPARQQGVAAGMNMAGERIRYTQGAPYNVTRLAGLTTTIIGAIGSKDADRDVVGIVRGDSETWRQVPEALVCQGGFEANQLRLLIGDKTLLGGLVMGDQKLSHAVHLLVEKKVDISPVRDQLLKASASPADVLAGFWQKVSAKVEAPATG
jgi:NADPH-dependent 2,4-dienoyl-CoA reductase/sulfur reductase-like enzyme